MTLFCLPSCTSHELQPLDKSVFRSFEHFWDEEVVKFFRTNPDRSLTKDLFGKIFAPVWLKCMTMSNIQNGFRACGIWPFDEDAIPEEAFEPSALTQMENKSAYCDQSMPTATGTGNPTSSHTVIDLHAVHAGPSGLQTPVDAFPESQSDRSVSANYPTSPSFNSNKSPEPGPSGLQASVNPQHDTGRGTDHVSKALSFHEVLKTPKTMRIKRKSQKTKSLNYQATVVSRSLFIADRPTADTLVLPAKQCKTSKQTAKKNNGEDNEERELHEEHCESDWSCPACREIFVADMRQCEVCRLWYHEDCVGLTADDFFFICPHCDE